MKAQIDFSKNPKARRISEEQAKEAAVLFNVHGALKINQAFSKTLVRSLQREFVGKYLGVSDKQLARHSLQVGNHRYLVPVHIADAFNDPRLYAAPRVLPVLEKLLGRNCVLHAFGAIVALPGADMQHFHIDHPQLFSESDGLETFLPPYAIHMSIPLIDLDEATGTTALWEGSHRKPFHGPLEAEHADTLLKDACFPYTKTGDCVLMDFRLWHRGTANQSNKARSFLYMVYSRSWFHDTTNYPKQRRINITDKAFQQVPEKHRKLFVQYKK